MRFDSGVLLHSGDLSNYPPVNEWVEVAKLLESAGYEGIWGAEHHFFWDGWTNPAPTNPLQFCTFLAGHTTKLRFGQCGVSLPDWHPIRVAEDVAMLDHMSRGRVDFGMIPGINNRVNGNFNASADRRDRDKSRRLFWESLEIIELAWKAEPFSFKGEFYEFPFPGWRDEKTPRDQLDRRYYTEDGELVKLEVVPTPLQKPGPPQYLMAESESSISKAAARGMNVMTYSHGFEATRHAAQVFAGSAVGDGHMSVMRPIFVAETQEAAEAAMRPAINGSIAMGTRAHDPNAYKAFLGPDEELAPGDTDLDPFDFLVKYGHCHVGTPEYVTERLKRYQEELGIEHIVHYWAVPTLSFEEQLSSLRLFADKVMPNF